MVASGNTCVPGSSGPAPAMNGLSLPIYVSVAPGATACNTSLFGILLPMLQTAMLNLGATGASLSDMGCAIMTRPGGSESVAQFYLYGNYWVSGMLTPCWPRYTTISLPSSLPAVPCRTTETQNCHGGSETRP